MTRTPARAAVGTPVQVGAVQKGQTSRPGRFVRPGMGRGVTGQRAAQGQLLQLGDALSLDGVERVGRMNAQLGSSPAQTNAMQALGQGRLGEMDLMVNYKVLSKKGLSPIPGSRVQQFQMAGRLREYIQPLLGGPVQHQGSPLTVTGPKTIQAMGIEGMDVTANGRRI